MSSARELERRVRRLQAVVDASLLVNSTLELDRLAVHVIEIATRLIGAERGSLFLIDRARGALRSMVAQGIDGRPLELAVGEGIVGTVAATGEAVILNDPYADPRFDPGFDRRTGYRTTSLLTVPVSDRDGNRVAVLQLLNHRGRGFTGDDVEFLAELGTTFAIALTTARLHRDIITRERVAEELRLAAEIQATLRPQDLSDVPGLEIEALARPCLEVGGDYYDLIPSLDGDRWWLVVADISGKGVSAGLIASNVQAYLWSRRADRRSLARVVEQGNDLLYRLARGRKYATMVVVEWRPSARELVWVNAGHPPAYLRCGKGLVELGATGTPIGLLPDQRYRRGRRVLAPGDLLVLYTDGLTEAGMGTPRGELGFAGLERSVRVAEGPADAVARLEQILTRHLGDNPPDDDVTFLAARVC